MTRRRYLFNLWWNARKYDFLRLIMRFLPCFLFVVLVFGVGLNTSIAHAAAIQRGHEQWACIEVERAAGIVQAEAFSQPREAQTAILQIVATEARSRRMSVCELSAQTWFVTVYQYSRQHPNSWTARQFVEVQPWALVLADDVLAGRLPDARRGAMHFDGAPCMRPLWVGGQIHFCE